jgi:ABC-type transporter Mla MlaB component
MGVDELPSGAETMVVTIGESIERHDVDGLCDALRRALSACDAELVVCDLGRVRRPDAAVIDLLARLSLTSRRLGRRMCLRAAPSTVLELVTFMGLAGVPGLVLEAQWQPEHREEVPGVEEEGDPGDPVA